MTYLRDLFDHVDWANRKILTLLRGQPEIDKRPLELLSHALIAERIWMKRIRGEPTSAIEIWPLLSLEELEELAADNFARYRELVDGLEDGRLSQQIEYTNSQGLEFRTPLRDILMHVALHGAYHRGQIATAIREEGWEPDDTDFITFVRTRRLRTPDLTDP